MNTRLYVLAQVRVEDGAITVHIQSTHDRPQFSLRRIVAILDEELAKRTLSHPTFVTSMAVLLRVHYCTEACVRAEIEPILQQMTHLLAYLEKLDLFRNQSCYFFLNHQRQEGLLALTRSLTE